MKYERIIILGATSGIGKALADFYISEGCTVGICARRTAILETMSDGYTNVHHATCDVCQTEDCLLKLQNLVKEMGGVDLFILCTGIGQMNAQLEATIEQRTLTTNVTGWTAIVDWIFSLFINQGHGHLSAISSIASIRGLGPAPSYSASKAYQAHYLEALHQLALATSQPIYVSNIRPGFVDTPMLANPNKFFWVSPVERAARQIIKGINKQKYTITVTRRWKLIVPLLLIVPNILIAKVIKRVL